MLDRVCEINYFECPSYHTTVLAVSFEKGSCSIYEKRKPILSTFWSRPWYAMQKKKKNTLIPNTNCEGTNRIAHVFSVHILYSSIYSTMSIVSESGPQMPLIRLREYKIWFFVVCLRYKSHLLCFATYAIKFSFPWHSRTELLCHYTYIPHFTLRIRTA